MASRNAFKLELDKERFLNNVYHDYSLVGKLSDVHTIISMKDLADLSRGMSSRSLVHRQRRFVFQGVKELYN
ncbi:MAG: hypothetical protein M1158_01790 [Candidatus Marsarchaeota archaeon]|nr:hypothetical protein [Candidatus Marsarchaeota archaeon]